ncbi:MAG: hypothetical protein KDJ15_00505, partial [Alphaproteobacteria bacterium]|nr:hypothetical protein [Alphaproteobacteria bacterium]
IKHAEQTPLSLVQIAIEPLEKQFLPRLANPSIVVFGNASFHQKKKIAGFLNGVSIKGEKPGPWGDAGTGFS